MQLHFLSSQKTSMQSVLPNESAQTHRRLCKRIVEVQYSLRTRSIPGLALVQSLSRYYILLSMPYFRLSFLSLLLNSLPEMQEKVSWRSWRFTGSFIFLQTIKQNLFPCPFLTWSWCTYLIYFLLPISWFPPFYCMGMAISNGPLWLYLGLAAVYLPSSILILSYLLLSWSLVTFNIKPMAFGQ